MNEVKITAYVTLKDGKGTDDVLRTLARIAPLYSIYLKVEPQAEGTRD